METLADFFKEVFEQAAKSGLEQSGDRMIQAGKAQKAKAKVQKAEQQVKSAKEQERKVSQGISSTIVNRAKSGVK